MGLLIRALTLVAIVVFPAQAFGSTSGLEQGGFQLAYIDPGAGSFVIQALLATIAGIAVMGRLYWSKIKRFFLRTPAAEAGTENEQADR